MNRAQSRGGIPALAALLPTLALTFGSLVAGDRPALADSAAPAVGKPAPAFKLQDQAGRWHSLADYKGKWVALYFYPKDDTPGCTTQACGFRDNVFAFNKEGAVIVGISVDAVASHKEFAAKHGLPFTILADSDKSVTRSYGVLKTYLGVMEMARRDTFIIDPQGRVAKHYESVNPEGHSQVVLADIKALKAAAAAGSQGGR
ncbi:MAG: peroxiredoxin [Steroidobacteraceae bacterium]|nr:peroxiredoxin [Steroidobacteraceae bacterium]MBP7015219.1 peroxiredoxin [Steroidobacteraceae bacterium]